MSQVSALNINQNIFAYNQP